MRQLIAAAVLAVSAAAAPTSQQQPASQQSPVKADLEKGYRLKSENKPAEAAVAFGAVLKKDPTNHAANVELGYLNAGLKKWNAAAKYLSAAVTQDPANQRLRMDLGYVYQSLKKPAQAAEQFKAAAELGGEFQQQARAALDAVGTPAVVPSESDVKARKALERGYAALGKGDKASARKAFASVVASDPRNEAALKQLGFLNLSEKRFAEAAKNFEAVRAINAGDHFIALQLGYTYDRLQQKERAREAFSAALASSDAKVREAAQSALQTSGGPAEEGAETAL
jgi:uncharacterized protein HemY